MAQLAAPTLTRAESAQPSRPAASPTAVEVAEGKRHFSLAQEHYRARRFREALHELELAYAKVPSPELLFNLARTHEQIGETQRAIARYEEYLATAPEGADAVREHVRELAHRAEQAQADAQRAGLRVDSNRDGARVELDGAVVGETPLEALLWVPPGAHQIEVSRAGDRPFRAELQLPAGSVGVAYADLSAHATVPPAPRDESSASTSVWIAAGVSACAALAGGALLWVAEGERQAGGPSAADDLRLAAEATFATALGAAVVAAVLHGFAPEEPPSPSAHQRTIP